MDRDGRDEGPGAEDGLGEKRWSRGVRIGKRRAESTE